MGCDRCDELLDTYKRSISLLRDAVRKVAGVQWPDSSMAVQEMTRLQQTAGMRTMPCVSICASHIPENEGCLASSVQTVMPSSARCTRCKAPPLVYFDLRRAA